MTTLLELSNDLGMELENRIRLKILSNVPPPLKESTIKRKGSSVTLIDTGQALASVQNRVDDSNLELLRVWAGIFDEDVAEYMVSHEYGREDAGIPCRSFIRSTYDECFDSEVLPNFVERIFKSAEEQLSKK
jgi:hypothetical protein